MNTQHKPTYISLFSSAGVGCYGFKICLLYTSDAADDQ